MRLCGFQSEAWFWLPVASIWPIVMKEMIDKRLEIRDERQGLIISDLLSLISMLEVARESV